MNTLETIATVHEFSLRPRAKYHMQEYASYYLLTFDLASFENIEVEVDADWVQLVETRDELGKRSSVLFECESSGKGVRMFYRDGGMHVKIPKKELAKVYDFSQHKRMLA